MALGNSKLSSASSCLLSFPTPRPLLLKIIFLPELVLSFISKFFIALESTRYCSLCMFFKRIQQAQRDKVTGLTHCIVGFQLRVLVTCFKFSFVVRSILTCRQYYLPGYNLLPTRGPHRAVSTADFRNF